MPIATLSRVHSATVKATVPGAEMASGPLSVRGRGGRRNPGTSAPDAIRLLATRAAGADRTVVVLAADLAGHSFAWCKRHAAIVLDALVGQFPGQPVDVQLLDAGNLPLFVASAGGAS